MEHEQRRCRSGFLNAIIKTHLVPSRQLFRLPLGQLCLHGKICLWKIERTLQVARFRHLNRGENAFLLTQAGKLGASVETCMLQ